MLPTKVTVIGAGSASFGLNTVSALLQSTRLRGSHLALVDRNPETLALMARLAARLNREWEAGMTLTMHTHHSEALEGTEFVVSAIEVPPREKLWRRDWEIPLKYGVRQPYAENGGPGGFAHAIRNVGPVLEIAHAMEQICPKAWFINFSNPMTRICDAIARYSRIRVVGLCHQINVAYALVGLALARELGVEVPAGWDNTDASTKSIPLTREVIHQARPLIDIQAAGLNHFTWVLSMRDRRTGADLYPLFAERWAALAPAFQPLTRRVYDAFGLLPVPGDQHLCEYLPWLSDAVTKPCEKYGIHLYDWEEWEHRREAGYEQIAAMADGREPIDHLAASDSEGAVEVIEAVAGAEDRYHVAVNVVNQGAIANLPAGAIVEVPGLLSGAGVHGVSVGRLPEAVAELLRREITVGQLSVDAAVHGDRQKALQCLLLSPCITDMDVARQILDDYLESYREHLPQFWQ